MCLTREPRRGLHHAVCLTHGLYGSILTDPADLIRALRWDENLDSPLFGRMFLEGFRTRVSDYLMQPGFPAVSRGLTVPAEHFDAVQRLPYVRGRALLKMTTEGEYIARGRSSIQVRRGQRRQIVCC